MKSSRDMIMKKLIDENDFNFAGYILNEIRATTLVLFKSIARWYNMPFHEANKITRNYKEELAEKEYTGWLKDACEELNLDWEDHWDILEDKMNFCYKYNKIPYNTGTAASGVIMTEEKLVVPIRDEVVMYNGEDLESYGYIKYDILTVTTLDAIQHFYDIDYDWNDVYDEETWTTICNGDTDFVFQFASPGMKNIIKSTMTKIYNEVVSIDGIGDLQLEHLVELDDGQVLSISEVYKEIEKGKEIKVKDFRIT